MEYQTYHHNRNYGCRITEFVYNGYRCITLENEKLRVSIAVDKGTDIYEFLYKPRDLEFLWRSWLGLRPASHFVPTSARTQGAHMDYYEGGWQELFPNCGGASIHQGAELGQHGEVMLLPWSYQIVRDDPEAIEVRFEVRTVRTPFHLVKTLSLRRGEPALEIHERVTNESSQAVDFTWGHHPALGWPFLDQTCIVELSKCTIKTLDEYTPASSRLKPGQSSEWPFAEAINGSIVDLSMIPEPEVGASDMVFLEGLEEGAYSVLNTGAGVGFRMSYPADLFKILWYWQVYRGGSDYPWWGSTYNIALEPCATMPNLSRAAKDGSALKLGPGESREIEMTAGAFEHP